MKDQCLLSWHNKSFPHFRPLEVSLGALVIF
nr:MAG TPA: hypothetical protein [Caudoviricetes sp.]